MLTSLQQAFRRFPALRERFNAVVVNFFKNAMTPTTKLVSDLVACVATKSRVYCCLTRLYSMQATYVNTTHPDFLNGHKVSIRL